MNELQHHGIPNMHWGKRNGPPYPLTKEEHNAVVRGGDIKTLRENITQFEDWEIEKTLKRFNYNQTIDRLKNSAEVNKGKQKFEKFMDKASNTERLLRTSVSAAEHGVRLYNTVANVMNTFTGKKMKTIPSSGGHGGNDNKHDNNHSNENRNNSSLTKTTDAIKKMYNKHQRRKEHRKANMPEWKKAGYKSEEDYKRKLAAIEKWKDYEKEFKQPITVNVYQNGKKKKGK